MKTQNRNWKKDFLNSVEYYGIQREYSCTLHFSKKGEVLGYSSSLCAEHTEASMPNIRHICDVDGNILETHNLGSWTCERRTFYVRDYHEAIERLMGEGYHVSLSKSSPKKAVAFLMSLDKLGGDFQFYVENSFLSDHLRYDLEEINVSFKFTHDITKEKFLQKMQELGLEQWLTQPINQTN